MKAPNDIADPAPTETSHYDAGVPLSQLSPRFIAIILVAGSLAMLANMEFPLGIKYKPPVLDWVFQPFILLLPLFWMIRALGFAPTTWIPGWSVAIAWHVILLVTVLVTIFCVVFLGVFVPLSTSAILYFLPRFLWPLVALNLSVLAYRQEIKLRSIREGSDEKSKA